MGISLASAFAGRRVDESSSFLSMALNNLSQGVVIFMDERLVFCNERFLTLYGLPGDIIKPGCTLRTSFGPGPPATPSSTTQKLIAKICLRR